MTVSPFVIVSGLPTGGTSMVAGILHRLGVSMGRCRWCAPGKRSYTRFEDRDLIDGYVRRVWPGRYPQPMLSACDAYPMFLDYVAGRQKASEAAVCGVKHARALYPATCPDWDADRFWVVDVRRDEIDRIGRDTHYSGRDTKRIEWEEVVKHSRLKLLSKTPEDHLLSLKFDETQESPARAVELVRRSLLEWFGRGPWDDATRRASAADGVQP